MSEQNGINLPTFYGQKAGMTRIFDEAGNSVPVTVVKLIPNYVSLVKTVEKDGYSAVQIAYGEKREKLVNKPVKGKLAKAKIDKSLTKFAEVKTTEPATDEIVGQEVNYADFEGESYVDVTGTSKGKGFQGVIKKFGFRGGPASHGSHFHRRPGSIGNRATPGKVWKNKKMPGHLGDKKKTIQNLKVIEVNTGEGYMLIKGSIPGSKNGFVRVSKSVKK